MQEKVRLDEFKVKRHLRNRGKKVIELARFLGLTYQGLLYRYGIEWPISEALKAADFLKTDLSNLTVDSKN